MSHDKHPNGNWWEASIINPVVVDNVVFLLRVFKLPGAMRQLVELLLALRENDPRFNGGEPKKPH